MTITFKANIVHDDRMEECFLRIENGRIAGIDTAFPGGEYMDFSGCYIVPGFIDLHIHGLHRCLIDNGADDLSQICRVLPQYGVTGFLPTVAPRAEGEDAAFLGTLARVRSEGAHILGFHLEGPFLKLAGALAADAVAVAGKERMEQLRNAAKPYRAVFSISPDVEGVESLIPGMAADGTPVFITHTAANVQQTQRAIELGARHATHFYDVFPCPAVTEPGVRPCGAVEAILADTRVSVDFILDGVHVDPVAVQMALVCKPRGVCLITDANIGAGLDPGRFSFGASGDVLFQAKGSPARLVKDNTLAGSGLTMDVAFRNAVNMLHLDIPQAVRLVSGNPAKVAGVVRKGRIESGCDADFVILDNRLEVLQTWIGGECCFKKDEL
ncbi:MAG: amidohydrolase family protein [Tannerella sp.]|jgi:N-acetylglucosamine-6-phosphate deacetylase|nr:amidohydrolase family protein [Tannerella sp.]